MQVCAKRISLWVKKVLSIAEAHVSRYSPRCYGVCNFGGWCFHGVFLAGW